MKEELQCELLICNNWYYILYALTAVHGKMVKCLVYGCNSGYNKKQQQVLGFSFLFNQPDLLTKWIKCDNQSEWKPIKNSIVCIKHLRMILLKNGKRMKLKRKCNQFNNTHTKSIKTIFSIGYC